MSFRRWQMAKSDKALSRSIAERFGIDGFTAHLLSSRGFCSDAEIKDMLGIDDDFAEFIDPFVLHFLHIRIPVSLNVFGPAHKSVVTD